jgi:hypothetical protein
MDGEVPEAGAEGDPGPDGRSDPGPDPELTLAAVVAGETRIRWAGLVVFLPGRVLMGCLGAALLSYYGVRSVFEDDPTLGRASRAIPEGRTVYGVVAGATLWTAGAVALLAAGPGYPPAVAGFALGWAGTVVAVAADQRRSPGDRPRLDRAAYLVAAAVPVLTGPTAAVYVSGRMRRAQE